MSWPTAVVHLVVAALVLAALVILCLFNKISGADAFTGIIGVAIAAGVISAANLSTGTTTPAVSRSVTTTAQPRGTP